MRAPPSTGIAAAIGLLAAAPACSGDGPAPYFGTTERVGKEITTLYANAGNEPEYLDPGKSNDAASSALLHQMFEGLTAYAPGDLHPTQGVATRWDQSDDNRIFRFYLRPEARWSDGMPVTAHDFEYSWKRALHPETASLGASNLHVLKNAELFNLGKLKALRADVVARAAPRPDAPAGPTLPRGAFVVVLARSPVKVGTRVAPLSAIPRGPVRYEKADPKSGAAERLDLPGEPGAVSHGPAPDGGLAGAEAIIVRAGPPVECNDAADRWFEIEAAGRRGFLPGCVLSPVPGGGGYALVARHERLPTYDPARPLESPKEPEPVGFVPEAELVTDDAVVGVRAAGDLILDVELERPTPYFTDLTSITTFLPVRRDVVERFKTAGDPDLWFRPESIVVNGPYVLDEWKFRYEISMRRNPAYWDRDRLKIHRIVWLAIEQAHAAMYLYKAGDIDYLGDNTSLPSEYQEFLSTKKDFHRLRYLSTYWYEFNVRKPPVDDPRVRWALNLALDKRQIVERITRAGQIPATHYVPDYTGSGYAERVAEDQRLGVDPFAAPEVQWNPERARALLAEAGYEIVEEDGGYKAKGFPPLEILYNTSEGHRQIAVAVQDMWRRHLGISVTLRNEEWKVMLKNYRDGHYQIVRFGWISEYNHPHTWLATFLSTSSQNRTGWSDKEFDDLVARASRTADPKESIRLYRQAEKRALDAMPKLPVYFYTRSTLMKPWVKGFAPNARNVHLVKWWWIDPGWRENPTNDVAVSPLEFPPPGRLGAVAEGAP